MTRNYKVLSLHASGGLIEEDLIALLSVAKMQTHDDLDAEDPLKASAKGIERLFTACVDFLRTSVPDSDVREMASCAWDIIHHRHVLTAVGLPVSTMTFSIVGYGTARTSIVHIPLNWVAMFEKGPVFQLGAGAFTCSKVVDAFHNHLEWIQERALAYEGAFLRSINLANPNAYQRQTMASPPVAQFVYPRKPVGPKVPS